MGQKAGSFYRIKDKEQGRDKQKMNKEQASKYRTRAGLASGVWLSGYTLFPAKQTIYRDTKIA